MALHAEMSLKAMKNRIYRDQLSGEKLPLIDELRISLDSIRASILANGKYVSDETLKEWQSKRDDIKEQILLIELVTAAPEYFRAGIAIRKHAHCNGRA